MTFPLTVEQIAAATQSNVEIVRANWDGIKIALDAKGIKDVSSVVAAIATIGVECHFLAVREHGDAAYFHRMYGSRPDYEVEPNTGLWKWRGRGYIQLTGKDNYLKYGKLTGLDLIGQPDLAVVPANAAKILVAYMCDHGCFTWASRGHWEKVRVKVNGGHNGFVPFLSAVWQLLSDAYL